MTVDLASFDLSGKSCIVTGSTRGLGRAIAFGMGRAGARVLVCARSKEQVDTTVGEFETAGIEAVGCSADVTDREQCRALVDYSVASFGRLDVLVCNHGGGVAERMPAIDESPHAWSFVLDLNLNSVFHCCQLAARQMIAQGGGGAIVIVSSTSAHVAHPNLLAYGAAKAGVNQLVRQLAAELGSHQIRVNAISPGFTTHRPRAPQVDPNASFDQSINERTPLGRSGSPEEFAGPVIFLASDAASYVTGVSLPVDGGYLIA